MATVERFEDLVMFKKARELASEVYWALGSCKDYGFRDQIQRASVSVVSNIAEGFESGSKQEFLNYLYIAKASAGEVRAQLYVAHDIGYLNIQTFKYLKENAESCSRLIASFIRRLKAGGKPGLQFKREPRHDIAAQMLAEAGLVRLPNGQVVEKRAASPR
ncbi:MAG: four helix bundle protein [Patescibacteria group bacterium]|nr:four helix bundle protein [Patescibacteria group bacterium]MDE1944097.1 four helix bundle protein [Patescibacteria group bacterium]MDE1945030.1 four helix bundle protein [Patescibacteria group bacterium]MDE2057490.1 four helix bundle protein [Patescibacteria group bacterium]